jgi:hypothetical protein
MIYDKLICEYELTSLALIGSRARGDFGPHSDLDLIAIGPMCGFFAIDEPGEPFIELHIVNSAEEWKATPSWWYALRELRIILDDGNFAELSAMLDEWKNSYTTPARDIMGNLSWLNATVRKLKNATSDISLAYSLETSIWQILAGVFISKNMPVPANSDMYRLAPSFLGEDTFKRLIMGSIGERVEVALQCCHQITAAHNHRIERTRIDRLAQ